MDWTPELLDRVFDMRASRKSWPAIAQEIGRSRSAVLCAVQRSGRPLPDVGTIMPPRPEPTPTPTPQRCEIVAPVESDEESLESRNARGAPAVASGVARPYILERCDWLPWLRERERKCGLDHWGNPCGRMTYKDTDVCLGHTVIALHDEYREDWLLRLAMLTETVTPRRLASAIRERIETRGWKLVNWSAEVGLPSSTAHKAIMAPDSHPQSFRKIASHFGFDFDSTTGSYRKRRAS